MWSAIALRRQKLASIIGIICTKNRCVPEQTIVLYCRIEHSIVTRSAVPLNLECSKDKYCGTVLAHSCLWCDHVDLYTLHCTSSSSNRVNAWARAQSSIIWIPFWGDKTTISRIFCRLHYRVWLTTMPYYLLYWLLLSTHLLLSIGCNSELKSISMFLRTTVQLQLLLLAKTASIAFLSSSRIL